MSTYTPHSEMHAADRGYLLTSVVSDIRSTSSLTDISNTCSRSSSRDSSRSSCNNSCTSRSLADTEEVSRDLLLQGAAIQAYESPIHLMPLGKEEEVAHRCCTLDDLQIRQHCTEQEQEQELGDLLVGEAIEELEGKLPVSSDTEMETCSGSPVEELPYHHHHQHQDHHHHYHHLQQQQQEQQQEQQQQQQQQQEQEQQQEQQQKKVLLDNNLLDNNKDCSYPIDESTRVSVLPLFTVVNKTEASGGPPTPSFEWKYEKLQQKLQQHQQQQHHHEQQQEQQQQMQDEEEGGDLALRWECRVVTPCVGLGVDCFSAEGCGVVVCGSPYSLFNNCCNVELPTPFVIRSGSSSSRDSLITPPTDSSGRGGLGAASAGDRKALTHVGHIEEEILLDADDKQAAAHTLGWGKPIKLFVGTWNTEYQEFATEYLSSMEAQLQARGEGSLPSKPTAMSLDWSETGSSQTQGGGSPLQEVQSSASTLTFAADMEADSHVESDSDDTTLSEAPPLIQRRSTLCLGKPAKNQQPLRDWLTPGYDVYVITLQEVTNDNIFCAIGLYLEVEHGERFHRVKMGDGKISGLGKGAWTKMKATSMACWIRESVRSPRGPVTPLAYRAFSFTRINGSKGALTLVLKIYDQVVCFVGCHMPASGVKGRFRARQHIRQKLAQVYSNSSEVDFTRVFHHVIWAGDFNFRLQAAPEVYMPLLEKQDMESLLQYDECREDFGQDMALHQMREAPVRFLPTYKKADGRPPLNTDDPDWILKEYQTQMKKGVLGQRKMVERPPSWCDRVFFWSMPAVIANLQAIPGAYFAAEPKEPSVLMASDHAPVGCGLELFALRETAPPVFFEINNPAETVSAKRQLAS